MTITERDLIELFRKGTTAELNDAIAQLTEQRGQRESERIYTSALKKYDRETEQEDGPVHDFFGLTYSSYQVVSRVLAQSMPHEWQARFVTLMEEYEAAFKHLGPIDYDVRPAVEKYAEELTDDERNAAGVFVIEGSPEGSDGYYDRDGNEIDRWTRVLVPVPDPLPPYSRGRTRVPRADQLAAAHSCDNCDGIDPDSCPFNADKEF